MSIYKMSLATFLLSIGLSHIYSPQIYIMISSPYSVFGKPLTKILLAQDSYNAVIMIIRFQEAEIASALV